MAAKKRGKRTTLRDKRLAAAAKTKAAPPARGQESLAEYMGEEKYLIRKPKRRRKSTGRYDN
jgi:hypothetical protein